MSVSFSDIAATIRPSYSTTDNVVESFYVPLLSRSSYYDRVAGYFTSFGLAVAARGLTSFIGGGGKMRLIVGAQLVPEDIAAFENGAELAKVVEQRLLSEPDLWANADEVRDHRLQVLAWLARNDRLDIKVGVRRRSDGTLVPATETTDYFHDKFGVFTDHHNQRVAFAGSNNETANGWGPNDDTVDDWFGNSESFWVFPEWSDGWEWSGTEVVRRFDRYWNDNHSPQWAIVPLSQAVRDELLRVKEIKGPPRGWDPELGGSHKKPGSGPGEHDHEQASDLLDQTRQHPFSGVMSAGVLPLPHQRAMINRAVLTYPRGYLFGDEVGLGKTIEVGLTVRELVLSGKASRVLLLVPAAVLGQWQEELFEKLALWAPRWVDNHWVWPDFSESPAQPGDPWASQEPIVLVSSHLARRNDQRSRILASSPWDIVVVDEAHHARRRGGKPEGSPNNLLSLLQELHYKNGWQALYLASATPMQMYPHEAWDLIELFNLPGLWAVSAHEFSAYFRELGLEWGDRQWNLLARMVRDHFSDPSAEPNGPLDAEILGTVKGADRASIIKGVGSHASVAIADRLCKTAGETVVANAQWVQPVGKKPELTSLVTAWLYTNNPMRDRVFRNTRDTLRAYRAAGMWPVEATIPDRLVDDAPVAMSVRERDLYCQVQTYIRTKYDQAQLLTTGQTKNALGFILTVYRRRLTSSFRAIERSLHRRVAVLEGVLEPAAVLTVDDIIFDEGAPELGADLQAWAMDDEIRVLHRLIDGTGAIANGDESKMLRLHGLVDDALAGGQQTVLVFTQYADTMEYIRDRLDAIYQGRVIGYASEGGTIRDPETGEWVKLTKTQTKELFIKGEQVKVLVGTDTLSEGLNLQSCGRLVNYDLPWNFTRVEQRIGRIDRIGGHDTVEVTNLLYEDTVETAVYRRLVETFGGFNAVVGMAQPVLGQVEQVIQSAALLDTCDDQEDARMEADTLFGQKHDQLGLDEEVAKVIAAANEANARTLSVLDEHGSPVGGVDWPEAKGLEDFEGLLFGVPGVGERLAHTEPAGVWSLHLTSGNHAVTFDRDVLARLSPDVQLLTWGSHLLPVLLKEVESSARAASSSTPNPNDMATRVEAAPMTIAEASGQFPLGDTL